MNPLLSRAAATALCGVTLAAAVPHAHAADAKVVLSAQLQGKPAVVIVGVDSTSSFDSKTVTQQMTDALTGTQWEVFDNGTIVISKAGKSVTTFPFIASQDLTLILPHVRGKDLTTGVDGMILRSPSNPTQGWADVWFTQPVQGGGTFTFLLDAGLQFAKK